MNRCLMCEALIEPFLVPLCSGCGRWYLRRFANLPPIRNPDPEPPEPAPAPAPISPATSTSSPVQALPDPPAPKPLTPSGERARWLQLRLRQIARERQDRKNS